MKSEKIESIVVFEKNITSENAEVFLKELKSNYREGMDSSRGKAYFHETGPKFIISFLTLDEKEKFISYCQNMTEIYEIYTPNWDVLKD